MCNYHRVNIVRNESRAAQLLYGFVRGVPYKSLEQSTKFCDYDRRRLMSSVKGKASRHGIDVTDFGEWMN